MDVAVGLDVAKEFHWAATTRLDPNTGEAVSVLNRRVDNTPAAFDGFLDEHSGRVAENETIQVGIDIVGGIARLVEVVLLEAGLDVMRVPGIAVKTARRATRGGEHNSEPRDARVVADQVRAREDLRRLAPLNEPDAGLAPRPAPLQDHE